MKPDKPKCYISGPISGRTKQDCLHDFDVASDWLTMWGFDPVSPMHNGLPFDAPYAEHLRRDIALLVGCESMLLLPGWIKSKGCRIEYRVATVLKIRIIEHQFIKTKK